MVEFVKAENIPNDLLFHNPDSPDNCDVVPVDPDVWERGMSEGQDIWVDLLDQWVFRW